jgi:hypothetical protein
MMTVMVTRNAYGEPRASLLRASVLSCSEGLADCRLLKGKQVSIGIAGHKPASTPVRGFGSKECEAQAV